MAEEKNSGEFMEIPNDPQISVRNNDSQHPEQLRLEVEEEHIGIIEAKQDDKELLKKQKTHGVLSDQELETMIGVNKRGNSIEMYSLKSEDIELSFLGNLKVSLFWEEKILGLIRCLQLMGFYFVVFYEQVPQSSQSMFNFIPGFILKFDYILYYQTSLSNYSFIMIYTFGWAGCCILLFLIFLFLHFRGIIQRYSISAPYWLYKSGFYVAEVLAFPFLMNTVPNAACQFRTSLLGVTLANCWSQSIHNVVVASAAVVIAIILLMAMGLWYISNSNYVYDTNDNHESYIKMKELEYVFDLSYVWRTNWFFLFASFRREGFAIFHRSIYLIYIIILTLLYSILVLNINIIFRALALIRASIQLSLLQSASIFS